MGWQAPNELFKFLHRQDLHWLVEHETLKVGSSNYYRAQFAALEVKDPTINDPNEGTLIRPQTRPLGPWSTEAEKSFFGLAGQSIPSNAVIQNNIVVDRLPDFHMICFALGPLAPVAKALCDPQVRRRGIEPYNACVRIGDVLGFLDDVINKGRILNETGDEIGDLGKYWDKIEAGPVRYADISVPMHMAAPAQNGFLKDLSFEHQQEFRIRLHRSPQAQLLFSDNTFIVRVPGLRNRIESIEIPEFPDEASSGVSCP